MKTKLLVCLATTALSITALQAQEVIPPGSNSFAGAPGINVFHGQSNTQDLTALSAEVGEPSHNPRNLVGGQHSAWWKWTAPATGFCTVDTRRSARATDGMTATSLAVYQGTALNNLIRVAANDQYSLNTIDADSALSSVVFYARAGSTYHIAADAATTGSITPLTRNIRLSLRLMKLAKAVRTGPWAITNDSILVDMGLVTLTTTATGRFSGKLTTLQKSYSYTGVFGTDGYATVSIERPGKGNAPPLPPITLVLDIAGDGRFTLNLDNTVTGNLLFEKQVFSSLFPNPSTGKYTAALAPGPNAGYGSLVMTVSANGAVKAAGTAPDGTGFTFSTALYDFSEANLKILPIFTPMFAKKGGLLLLLFIQDNGSDDLLGNEGGFFVRPPASSPTASFYPSGLRTALFVLGSAYNPAPSGRALGFLDGSAGAGAMEISDIALELPGGTFVEALTLTEKNKFIFASAARKPSLKLNAKTGQVTGGFTDDNGKKRAIKGVLVKVGGTPSIVGMATGTALTLPVEVSP